MSVETDLQSFILTPLAGPAIDPFTPDLDTRTILGRSAECGFCLQDSSISRKHLALDTHHGRWMVIDLDSRHGTFINGTRLVPHKPILIAYGDLLRVGPFTFRVDSDSPSPRATTQTEATIEPGSFVKAISDHELGSLAHKRLVLLTSGCDAIYQATTAASLAQAVIKLILSGTNFSRAAVLYWTDSFDRVEIVAFHDAQHETAEGFVFSRSLLQASASGSVARLAKNTEHAFGQSIAQLGITAALCAPLIIDSIVVGAIYLDSRKDEVSPQPDAESFCHAVSQVASLAFSNLKRIELAKRQACLDADLKIAQEAQSFLLPAPVGKVGTLEYASRTCPGAVVGGDLFDIFEINDHQIGICFGDITGHGIGAAVLMTAVLSNLRAALVNSGDPATAVTRVNAYLAEHSSDRMFATLWAGIYDTTNNLLTYVDAGHGHWLICDVAASPERPKLPGGLIVGIQPDYQYAAEHIELKPSSRLVLYSDGLVEQSNSENEQFGSARLQEIISHSDSIHDDVAGVFTALEEFAKSSCFSDDTTIASILIRR